MFVNERHHAVRRLIYDYVQSPSLRHIRHPNSLTKIAQEIVAAIDYRSSIWKKWEGHREPFLRSAALCWIPILDLLEFLNGLPGPQLTKTDVEQRLRAFHEEPHESYPKEVLQAGCLELYAREKASGTEMPAIVGALQEFLEREEARIFEEQQAAWRQRAEDDRIALEQRFLSGADCKWTQINRSKKFYMRKNGRAYRLSQIKEKHWDLHRIEAMDDAGKLIGTYGCLGDVTKALQKIAYEPEPRW